MVVSHLCRIKTGTDDCRWYEGMILAVLSIKAVGKKQPPVMVSVSEFDRVESLKV